MSGSAGRPSEDDALPSPVIVALDVDTGAEAHAIVRRLGDAATHYKIGLQLLTAAGPSLVRALVDGGKRVFLDLKLHEIPNSVAGAVRAAGRLGVGEVTVHASGGPAVLRAAVEAAAPYEGLRVLALTVITSLRDADLPALGLAPDVDAQVRRLAGLAAAAGCHGVVASVREAADLRGRLPAGAHIVCPGIQLAHASGVGATDQVRVATPAEAARAGASQVIVGRAITAAADPAAAFRTAVEAFRSAHDTHAR